MEKSPETQLIFLFIGRFQPWHNGHTDCLKQILALNPKKILLGIGSCQEELTSKNPLSFYERKDMLETFLKSYIKNIPVEIWPIPDFGDEQKWINYILDSLPYFNAVFSGNSYTELCFKNTGKQFFRPNLNEIIKASTIRSLSLRQNSSWQNYVPSEVTQFLNQLNFEKRLQQIELTERSLGQTTAELDIQNETVRSNESENSQVQKNIFLDTKPKAKKSKSINILIVEKYTDLQCLEAKKLEEVNIDRPLDWLQKHHLEHLQTKQKLIDLLEQNSNFNFQFIKDDEVNKVDYHQFKVIFSLGGDGTFLHASSKITSQAVAGIKSQISKSVGHLTRFDVNNINLLIKNLKKLIYNQPQNELKTKYWDRLQARVNQQVLPFLAINEIFVGVDLIYKTSHLEFGLKTNEENLELTRTSGNGIIVSTYHGSSAFYHSSNGVEFDQHQLGYCLLLPYKIKGDLPYPSAGFSKDRTMQIVPKRLNHYIIFDSDEKRKIKLKQEDLVEICTDPKNNLKVIVPQV